MTPLGVTCARQRAAFGGGHLGRHPVSRSRGSWRHGLVGGEMIEEVWNERQKKAGVGDGQGVSEGQAVSEGQGKQPSYAGSAS